MYSERIPEAIEGGSGWLDELLPLRRDLLEGDLRALHLAWLSGLRDQNGVAEEAGEPPVPPGLGQLSEPHDALVRFLRIDRDIVAAAAERSARVEKATPSERELSDWIRALPGADKDDLLLRLLREGDGLAAAELRQRYCQARSCAGQPGLGPAPPARTVGQILRRAAELAEARRLREADEVARKVADADRERARVREARIAALRGREEAAWIEVDRLCVFRTMSAIDSGRSRPPIPIEAGHRFRGKPATHSGASRPSIPIEAGHFSTWPRNCWW
jgi:hypothetical protein